MKQFCPKGHDTLITGRNKYYHCKECSRLRSKSVYAKGQYKKYYSQRQEFFNRCKMKPCHDCGVQYSPWVMQFDHRDPAIKELTLGKLAYISKKKLPFIEKEIAKCDVVCANCHCERTHKQQVRNLVRVR